MMGLEGRRQLCWKGGNRKQQQTQRPVHKRLREVTQTHNKYDIDRKPRRFAGY